MKQIKFNPELIGKPNIEVRYRNGEVPDWYKIYTGSILAVDPKGTCIDYFLNGHRFLDMHESEDDLVMYRQQRSAEDIAKEVYDSMRTGKRALWMPWDNNCANKELFTALVTAGMDEMKGGEE